MSRSAARRSNAPPQRVSLLLEIYSLEARTSALLQREFARDGLSLDGYAMLTAIHAFEPITLTELATMLGTPLTTMSDSARRLEGRGHVQRRPNPGDGRSTLFEVTPAGDEAARAGWPALQRATAAIRSALGAPEDEVRAAVRTLDAAVAAALTDT